MKQFLDMKDTIDILGYYKFKKRRYGFNHCISCSFFTKEKKIIRHNTLLWIKILQNISLLERVKAMLKINSQKEQKVKRKWCWKKIRESTLLLSKHFMSRRNSVLKFYEKDTLVVKTSDVVTQNAQLPLCSNLYKIKWDFLPHHSFSKSADLYITEKPNNRKEFLK